MYACSTFLFDFQAHNIEPPFTKAATPSSDPAPLQLPVPTTYQYPAPMALDGKVGADGILGQHLPPYPHLESLSLSLPAAPDADGSAAAPGGSKDAPHTGTPMVHALTSMAGTNPASQQQQGGGTTLNALSPRYVAPRAASAASTPSRHHAHTHAAVAPSPKVRVHLAHSSAVRNMPRMTILIHQSGVPSTRCSSSKHRISTPQNDVNQMQRIQSSTAFLSSRCCGWQVARAGWP